MQTLVSCPCFQLNLLLLHEGRELSVWEWSWLARHSWRGQEMSEIWLKGERADFQVCRGAQLPGVQAPSKEGLRGAWLGPQGPVGASLFALVSPHIHSAPVGHVETPELPAEVILVPTAAPLTWQLPLAPSLPS